MHLESPRDPLLIQVGPTWEGIGPFPSGMREHPLLASPLHAYTKGRSDPEMSKDSDPEMSNSDPDLAFAFAPYGSPTPPSEYARGGYAVWRRWESDGTTTRISFPAPWGQLRSDHGWASVQYRAEVRSTLTIPGNGVQRVRIDAGCAEYAFVRKDKPTPLVWYNGDVYGFADIPSGQEGKRGLSNYARGISLPSGEYIVLVRALYEIRMFGDPGEGDPVINLKFQVRLDVPELAAGPLVRTPTLRSDILAHIEPRRVVPDIRGGWFMGSWMGIAVLVRAATGRLCWETVSAAGTLDGVEISADPVHIAEGQTRLIPLRIKQTAPLSKAVDHVTIVINEDLPIEVPLRWRADWEAFKMTFRSDGGNGTPACVSVAMVLPPPKSEWEMKIKPTPVLLALHGAGVDVKSPFWLTALPQIRDMWSVLPSGRNEWGEDWHGSSLVDVWAARDALAPTLALLGIDIPEETILIGHSNGGQGAWYAAMRYPERVRGVIAVSGYTTIRDYVGYTELTSSSYADPALMGILSASLAPYDNNLHASNLASVRVLALHGGDDDNVPARHARKYLSTISSWLHHNSKDIQYVEVPRAGHWWDGILQHPAVIDFITTLPPQRSIDEVRDAGFTLTCANPDECGGKAGIRIVQLGVPGKLARLDVNAPQWKRGKGLSLHSTNVKRIEISGSVLVRRNGQWEDAAPGPSPIPEIRAYGPMLRLLASTGPMVIVIPDVGHVQDRQPLCPFSSIAVRYAHDLYVYHRLDAVILQAGDALRGVAANSLPGNFVVIGRPEENRFAAWMIAQKKTPIRFPTKSILSVDGRVVWERGAGIIALHPHPTHTRGLSVIVAGNDIPGLELVARLLPLRTGVPIPDWVVATPRCKWQGAGAFAGAGFWSGEWGWSEMCWMDRE